MELIRSLIAKYPVKTLRKALIALGALVLSGILIWGCISSVNASNIQRKYAKAKQTVAESLYASLYMMGITYDSAALVGADVEGNIIPSMKDYYLKAQAQNAALTDAFGESCRVLDDNLIAQLDQAFHAYDDAFDSGAYTDDAAAMMTQAIVTVRESLDKHFDSDARLIIH